MTDNRQIVFDALRSAGLSPQQALGAMWSLGGESGAGFDTSSYNPKDPGGSVGIGQWNRERRTALENFARQSGESVTDIRLQARYLVGELTGEKWAVYQPGVLAAIKQAQTPEEAAHIWTTKFERPTVDNSSQRIAGSAGVGTIDAQGNFVPGTAKSAPYSGKDSFAGGAGGAGAQTNSPYPGYRAPTPMESLGTSLGSELASMASSGGGGGGGQIEDPPDQPAIRSPALDAQFTQTPSPVPAQFAGGLGSQLAALGIQPQTGPMDASVTQGAPSMTAMLGQIGGQGANIYDPRRPSTYNPNASYTQIG